MSKDYKNDIDFISKQIADAINHLNAAKEHMSFVFERNPEWNNMVKFDVDDAIVNLGIALATFYTWYDDEEESKIVDDSTSN